MLGGEIAFVGQQFLVARTLLGGKMLVVLKYRFIVCQRLTMCANGFGFRGRYGRVLQDLVGIVRASSMVSQPCRADAWPRCQDCKYPGVQALQADLRKGQLDGAPHQFVAVAKRAIA